MGADTKPSSEARCVCNAQAILGESPLWVAAEEALYWVDIGRAQILRHYVASGRSERCSLPAAVSALAEMADGRLLCTARRSLHAFDTHAGRIAPLTEPRLAAGNIRINDGGMHPDGAFWFGTMDCAERNAVGNFHRLDEDGRHTVVPAGYAITNGPAFSPDGCTAYFVDSLRRRVLSAPLDSGRLAAPLRLFAEIAASDGYPDGLAVDADGGVWCAHWGGARVTRFDAAGRISDTFHLPAINVTKCAFGGALLDRLFVTTARKGLDAATLASQPLAGGLFELDVGYRGLPLQTFRYTALRDAADTVCVFEPT